jgi:hypothetical protein
VDSRHYSSLLILAGMVAVAWVMSHLPVGDHAPDPIDGLPEQASVSQPTDGGSAQRVDTDPVGEVPTREVSAEEALPLIPGLVDRQGADERSPARLPLSPAGTRLSERGASPAGDDPSVAADDGTSAWPSFSMPNTQPTHTQPTLRPIPGTGPLAQSSGGPAAGVGQSAAEPTPTAGPAEFAGVAAGGFGGQDQGQELRPPQLLPGDRHVLRPIIRRSAETPPAVPVDPVWEAPMPGVKGRDGGPDRMATVPVLGDGGGMGETPARSVQHLRGASGDPAASQAAADLFRLPGEETGGRRSVVGDSNWGTPVSVAGGAAGQPSGGSAGAPWGNGGAAEAGRLPQDRQNPRARRGAGDYIWHVIQKNQSLESISFQYQGDESLVPRLRQLNVDILTDPQLLPIGRAIRVPVR